MASATLQRAELQVLASLKLEDAKRLLAMGRAEAAYYLAGYTVECALKAAIARQTREHDFPDRKRAQDSHTHDLDALVRVAGLGPELEKATRETPQLAVQWTVVKDWSERSRYERHTARQAGELLNAIEAGVLPWITQVW